MTQAQNAGQGTEMEQLSMSIQEADKLVKHGDALNRLLDNADFKLLVLDEYLRDYAVSLVKSKAAAGGQGEMNQTFIANQINAIGHFDQFLRVTSAQAHQARIDIADAQLTQEEILAEDN